MRHPLLRDVKCFISCEHRGKEKSIAIKENCSKVKIPTASTVVSSSRSFHGHQTNCTENLSSNTNYYLKSNYIKIHLSTNFDRLWLLTLTTIKCYLTLRIKTHKLNAENKSRTKSRRKSDRSNEMPCTELTKPKYRNKRGQKKKAHDNQRRINHANCHFNVVHFCSCSPNMMCEFAYEFASIMISTKAKLYFLNCTMLMGREFYSTFSSFAFVVCAFFSHCDLHAPISFAWCFFLPFLYSLLPSSYATAGVYNKPGATQSLFVMRQIFISFSLMVCIGHKLHDSVYSCCADLENYRRPHFFFLLPYILFLAHSTGCAHCAGVTRWLLQFESRRAH